VAEHKEESFRVIDKRPFTAEGELRPDVVAQQEREARMEAVKEKTLEEAAALSNKAAVPAGEVPKKSIPFDNLVRMIAQNAAMVLGGYADPRTGQPVIDPEAARELIDMLDALQEKTKGNLAPEDENTLVDLLGKLKMTFLEVNQAMAAEMAKMQAQGKTRG